MRAATIANIERALGHDHRKRIPALAARATTASADARVVRRPRHAALALPQARATRRIRSCSSRSSAASASAATRSSACPRRSASAPAAPAPRSRIAAAPTATKGVDRPASSSSSACQARFAQRRAGGCRGFCGGLAGYFGYDTVRHIEKTLASAARRTRSARPDILLLLTDELAVVDNLSGKIYLIVYADPAARCLRCAHEPAAASCAGLAGAFPKKVRQDRAGRAQPSPAERVREPRRTWRRCGARRNTSRRRHHAGGAVAAHCRSAIRRVAAVAVPRAALAQSVAVHVLLRLRRLPRRRARRPRSWCAAGRRATRSRSGRSPARARAARRRKRTPAVEPSCWPTRRSAPST